MNVTRGLATRTSRRGMFGRTARMLTGAVAGGAMFTLLAENAQAASCGCSHPCLKYTTCECSPRVMKYYQCPSCSTSQCFWRTCSQLAC